MGRAPSFLRRPAGCSCRAVQDEIAGAVVEALKVRLLGGHPLPASLHRTGSAEAYAQYLLGREPLDHATRQAYAEAVQA